MDKNKIIDTEIGCHTYIECSCHSFDHIVKIGYLEGDLTYDVGEFYIEFRHQKYPIKDRGWYTGKLYKLYKLKNYLLNVWYAIKGKPNRYTLEALWEIEQAIQIKQFIEHCTERYNLKKGEQNEI